MPISKGLAFRSRDVGVPALKCCMQRIRPAFEISVALGAFVAAEKRQMRLCATAVVGATFGNHVLSLRSLQCSYSFSEVYPNQAMSKKFALCVCLFQKMLLTSVVEECFASLFC